MRSKSPKTEHPDSRLPDFVTVGRIVRPHGVRGEVAVELLTDHPRRFARGAELRAVDEEGSRRTLRVERAATGAKGLRVLFEGVADRDAAEGLRGLRLEVAADQVPPPPRGSHYYFELVGCRCHESGGGELGPVEDLVESGGGLLLQVRLGDGRTLLVPYAESFLERVEIGARRIELRLPEGFIETCASRS